ncbi:hypothetical protein G6321_00042555 [Bradyrhizobium barranii subsp. barranii]|uniref:Uncharacterized protein n=1 Tax=Bradyrhizobium barranii subsp. barranii TaxID=2823807 RepID=A0A7Z0QC10_9BRAD|nr:hypothetical protein [Bradyrhizobium barranii]UGX92329.1 hypothetical protein G6321_00042555 [Bradyrhizobium barranii subsp. barranii]
MKYYTEHPEPRNDFAADDSISATDRHARRLSHRLGFPIAHVRTALVVNAAVKEQN